MLQAARKSGVGKARCQRLQPAAGRHAGGVRNNCGRASASGGGSGSGGALCGYSPVSLDRGFDVREELLLEEVVEKAVASNKHESRYARLGRHVQQRRRRWSGKSVCVRAGRKAKRSRKVEASHDVLQARAHTPGAASVLEYEY